VNAAFADDGSTALMIASYKGHLSTVQLLLASGANKEAINTAGKTALAMASTNEIKRALKERSVLI
jgi:ankyrin repeat protein